MKTMMERIKRIRSARKFVAIVMQRYRIRFSRNGWGEADVLKLQELVKDYWDNKEDK